jgi:dihydroorotate dehydrogenase electron transfer subunit
MQKIVEDHQITEIYYPVEGNYIVTLKSPVDIPTILPGHFAEIRIHHNPEVFLRRPFSILDVDYEKREIRFYVKVIGEGTKQLGEYNIGEKVNLIYPLGKPFSIPESASRVLIVAGGSGIAPFILLGKALKKKNISATFLLGGRSKKDILLIDEFAKYGDVYATTEDGSLPTGLAGSAEQGLVTQHSIFNASDFNYDKIYTCGPDPMMHAVGKIAQEKDVDCEVSLENMMACGFGICLCCTTATHEGNKRVCIDGPVFNVNDLKW